MRSVPLVDVELIQVDRGASFADFNQAERMQAEGKADQSLARYRRAMRITEGFWSEVVPVRFARAADLAEDIETATDMLIRVTQGRATGPATAIRMLPAHIPDRRNGKVAGALDALNSALAHNPDHAARTAYTVLRHRILRRVGEAMSPGDARHLTELTIPESVRTSGVYGAVVEAFSFLIDNGRFESGDLDALDRAILDGPEEMLVEFLLLKGAALHERAVSAEDWIRASWPFLRVVIHFPNDPHVGEGYYGAAVALERAGLHEDAASLLSRCIDTASEGSELSRSAETFLERIGQSEHNEGQ